MKIHFFEAKSRIGLKNKPIHQKEFNLGVEYAPDYILSQNFLRQLDHNSLDDRTSSCYQLYSFSFPNPEDVKSSEFNQVLARSIKDFISVIQEQANGIQVVIGGDHTVALPSTLADLERIKDPSLLALIHIDSHGDINLSSESPTDNFHGMYLRPLFDKFDIPEIETLVPNKIPVQNLMIIGNLDLDPGEASFLAKNKIKTASLTEVRKRGFLKEFKDFTDQFKYLHISFDIDVMDKSLAPATGLPAENGFLLEDIEPIIEIIRKHGRFSFDLCEVNPRKPGSRKTIKIAQKILHTSLIGSPPTRG